jgi:RNA polymerase sigma factor (sigma-70 family)
MVVRAISSGLIVPCERERGPVHGPYAEAWYDEKERVHRVRLTANGSAAVADYLSRFPHPIALLISIWPSTYRAARAAKLSEEEIDALCLEGVALAFVRYDPKRGASIGTAITWSIRASVGNAVRRARKESLHCEYNSTSFESRTDRYLDYSDDDAVSAKGIIAAKSSSTMEDELNEEIAHYLALANLTSKERYILTLRFGLSKGTPLSAAEIGFAMGLSTERVRQLREKAIRKIRKAVGLDIDWHITARTRIMAYLSSLPNEDASQVRSRAAASKAEICKRARVTTWQFREVMPRLLQDGLVKRERVEVSRERWGIIFRVRESNQSMGEIAP